MKKMIWMALALFCASGCRSPFAPSLNSPGTLFLKERVKNIEAFKKGFLDQRANLEAQGFQAYSLHRDLQDTHTLILILKCSNLGKGLAFVRSPDFLEAMDDKAGAKIPILWYGLDVTHREFTDQAHMSGGIVIARNEVRSYKFWKYCFDHEDGGKHNHPGRKYANSNYCHYWLPGDPEVAIVTHDASDVSKAPVFMNSDPLNDEMEATGVVGVDFWYGINLEEGTL